MSWFGGGGSSSSSSSSSSSNSSDSNSTSSTFTPTSSPFTSGGASPQSSSIKAQLVTAITQQSNIANARALISKVNETCFAHCVPSPGSSLSGKEEKCLSACMEKYIDAWNVVNRTYIGRLQREGARIDGMTGRGAAASSGVEGLLE